MDLTGLSVVKVIDISPVGIFWDPFVGVVEMTLKSFELIRLRLKEIIIIMNIITATIIIAFLLANIFIFYIFLKYTSPSSILGRLSVALQTMFGA